MTKLRMKMVVMKPWKWDGIVLTGGNSQDYKSFVKREFDADVETNAYAVGHAHMQAGIPFSLWVESLDNIPALAHEALHITAGLLEARGLKFSVDSEEAYTYTMEDLIRQALGPKDWQVVKGAK